jgi:hypothetical protein
MRKLKQVPKAYNTVTRQCISITWQKQIIGYSISKLIVEEAL